MQPFISIIDILHQQSKNSPDKVAVKFISQKEEEVLTYATLFRKIKIFAQVLQQSGAEKESRAILLLPPGLEYIISFLGCLYAGVIAVPLYPPRKNQHAERVYNIIDDAKPNHLITNEVFVSQFSDYQLINVDKVNDEVAHEGDTPSYEIAGHQIAFIQYTSGSTNQPKGVLISHDNLIENMKVIKSVIPVNSTHRGCSWLPPYHDMGLIGGILTSFYIGSEIITMSPAYFFQSPARWLEILSKEKVTLATVPNFALEYCLNKISSELIEQLDLSHLQCIFNGAEPIQLASIKRFIDTFTNCKLNPDVIYPCYGLAEATLMLTAKQYQDKTSSLSLNKSEFEQGRVVLADSNMIQSIPIVNCGKSVGDHHLQIVSPTTRMVLPELEIGEIWASGPGIARGYWNQPELTREIFGNVLASNPDISYMRTGDLGFMYQGDLFITGRMSDLIIIRGKNYYPQDIEQCISKIHPDFEPLAACTFGVEVDGTEELVVLQEIKREAMRRVDKDAMIKQLRQVLLEQFELIPYAIVFLNPFTLPKTSSGKIQHNESRKAFLQNQLRDIARWERSDEMPEPLLMQPEKKTDLEGWLECWLKQHLNMTLSTLDYEKNISELGINSIAAVELSHELKKSFGDTHDWLSALEQCSIQELISCYDNAWGQTNRSFDDLKKLYFKVNDGISSNMTAVDGEQYINYSGYNYLGLSGYSVVTDAVIDAVKEFGTSVSASRLVSGEKSLHVALEKSIADLIGTEDCVVLPSGYATNIAIITHLLNKDSLIIYDEFSHNSIIQAALFSGANRVAYPHNQYEFVADFLEKNRQRYRKVLIVTEGIFSMDGDIPDVNTLISIKKRFDTQLMIDEAHSMGVLGKTGCGIREYQHIDPHDVDIWMGTLSKSFASCGGYIAGSHALIENFKYTAAGFIYSAGISPSNTAAALAAIQVMQKEPWRVETLHQRSELLLSLLKQHHIPTGLSQNTPIIPIIVREDAKAIALSQYLKQHHIWTSPIIYPAVERNLARVRLFVNGLHTEEQIYHTARVLSHFIHLDKRNQMDLELC